MMYETMTWYAELMKPAFAPPSWVFGPVWSVLYVLIAISFGGAVYLWMQKKIKGIVLLPFALNLVFNALFSPIQFGLQSNLLAAIDILLVDATLIWAMWWIWKKAKWITYMNIPYLAWVLFATVLQLTITVMNW